MDVKLRLSAFVTYTHSAAWAGNIRAAQTLWQCRKEFECDAKAILVGMSSNGFTLVDSADRGMLDALGFDNRVPTVIADLVRAA